MPPTDSTRSAAGNVPPVADGPTLTGPPADAQATAPFRPAGVPPDAVPGYQLIETLGEGGMGVVYKARQVKLNRVVALKMILGGHRAGPKDLIRFLAEAEAVAAVRHPHVVQVFEFGDADGRPFLALEYLPGGSLADRLRRGGRLSPVEAAGLVGKLAAAVQAAHELGIVHRDLKPSNVLFDAAGEPKVVDFGLAKRAGGGDLTATQAVMGTPAYMAPEQAKGDTKFVGPQADVYALGVILYECLTGTRPHSADDRLVLLRKVAEDDPVPPRRRDPGLPRDLDLVCLKCLAKDPGDRYATAEAVAADLARFAAGQSVSVRAPGPAERAVRWARRNPTRAAAYALAVLAVVLGGSGTGLGILWRQAERDRRVAEGAREEADRANDREAEARAGERRALLEAYEASIRLALQKGAFAEALALIDRAPALGLPVPSDLRLGEVRALIALGRDPAALTAVRALAAGPLPPDLRGRVELVHGSLLFGEDDAAGTALVRAALARDLSPPDRAYAEALLTDSSVKALLGYQAARAADPFHQRAHAGAIALLLLLGRTQEALGVAAEARERFPRHPDFLALTALGTGLQDGRAAADRWLAELKAVAPAESHQAAELLVRLAAGLTPAFKAGFEGGPVPPPAEWVAGLGRPLPRPAQAIGLFGRTPPNVRGLVSDLAVAARSLGLPDGDLDDPRVMAELRRLAARHPEGTLLFLLAMNGMTAATNGKPSEGLAYARRYEAAADEFERAARTPAMLDVRGTALEGAAMCRAVAGRAKGWDWGPGSADQRKRSAQLVRERLALGPVSLERISILIRVLQNAGEYSSARLLVDDWERRAPADTSALRARAKLEYLSEAYPAACRAAERVLARDPKDQDARDILSASRVRLVVPEVGPPPRLLK